LDIGIGLPTTIPGATPEQILESARRADAAGFTTLGTIDRLVYPNYEPLAALAAAAAVTERAKLMTAVALAPLRANAALFAKQAATVHRLSNSRLVLGLAVGGRPDDFEASGLPMEGRGTRLVEMLEEIKRVWSGEERGFAGGIGPDVSDDPPSLILGGSVDATFKRAAKFADGWVLGAQPPESFAEPRDKLRAAFEEAGRSERPRTYALSYFSLDDDPEQQVRSTVGDYYSFAAQYADLVVDTAAKGEDAVRERIAAFEAAECDELIMFPASPDPEQVDKLAAIAL
jgi:alkanesulfonate monooxygenase SsuD/methylene tetrahydromethanopterin reductase-like flavin-dependent oxidoreductase (luciferase family)